MMRGTWKIISSNARSKALAFEESLPVPLLVQPMKSARVMRLRFDAEDPEEIAPGVWECTGVGDYVCRA